jgi:hypothetical protein
MICLGYINFFNINKDAYETAKLLFLNFDCSGPCSCCLWIIAALKHIRAGIARLLPNPPFIDSIISVVY